MSGAQCTSTLCWALRDAKPEVAANLKPGQLQGEVDLLQLQLDLAKAVQAGSPLQDAAAVAQPNGPLSTLSWALKNAKPEAYEKLSPAQLQNQIDLLTRQLEIDKTVLAGLPAPELPPVAAPQPELPPVAALQPEMTPVAAPIVEAPIAATVIEAPIAPPVIEAPIAAPVVEAPIATPILEAPAAAIEADAPMAAVAKTAEMFAEQPAITAFKAEAAASYAAPVAEAALNTADQVPWGAFGVAFTLFPAAVIIGSKVMDGEFTAPATATGGATAGSAAPPAYDDGERSAEEIFMAGINQLGKEPTGWFFGKPSALYSNAPPPAPPAEAKSEAAEDMAGVVTPTAARVPSRSGEVGMVARPSGFDVSSMPGVTMPLGYFDPLGFCGGDVSPSKVKFFREAEIKHGRVAMLASVGFVVGEKLHPLWGGGIDVPSYIAWQETPLDSFMPAIALLIGIHEVLSIFSFNSPFGGELWSIRTDYRNGDLGWDPLGFKPKDAAALRDMQTKEINNGRLAMIGITGMVGQELATNNVLF